MLIGYARVSTADQTNALQLDALKAAGVERIFTDTASGARADRPGLAKAVAALQPGDTLVVWRLDRAGRSLSHLLALIGGIESRGAHFRSLNDHIDTSSATGRLVFNVLGSLAQFERELTIERVNAGLAAAKARGQRMGRRPKLAGRQRSEALRRVAAGEEIRDVAALCGVSYHTLWRAVRASR
jgi:DNA invertase Pin-like site-specific DNA recombinase